MSNSVDLVLRCEDLCPAYQRSKVGKRAEPGFMVKIGRGGGVLV